MKHLVNNSSVVILSVILSLGCVSVQNIASISNLPEETLSTIPKGAKSVVIRQNNSTADMLYEEIFAILLDRGHRILKDDKERHYITTEGKDVGESTLQRMTIVIKKQPSYIQAKITTDWKPGTEAAAMATAMSGLTMQIEWSEALWESNRLGIAFAESVAVASDVEQADIFYYY